jgi:hypothetical protein
MAALERNSETLDRISTAFTDSLAKNENIRLWSYSEEKQIRVVAVAVHVVPPDSAKIGHHRERWGSIAADHKNIAKYSSASDDGFVKVSSVLREWVREISSRVNGEVRLPGMILSFAN